MDQLSHVSHVGFFGSQQLLHVQTHDVIGSATDLGDFTHLPRDLRGYGRADLSASDFEARHGVYHGEHACARIAVFGRHARGVRQRRGVARSQPPACHIHLHAVGYGVRHGRAVQGFGQHGIQPSADELRKSVRRGSTTENARTHQECGVALYHCGGGIEHRPDQVPGVSHPPARSEGIAHELFAEAPDGTERPVGIGHEILVRMSVAESARHVIHGGHALVPSVPQVRIVGHTTSASASASAIPGHAVGLALQLVTQCVGTSKTFDDVSPKVEAYGVCCHYFLDLKGAMSMMSTR